MAIDLEKFRAAYDRWVEESLPHYRAGNLKAIVDRYPFIVPDDIPWAPYSGEPSKHTFAFVTSGGLYLKGTQPPFDTESIHGDPSFRELPRSTRPEDLGIAHAHYDHSLAEQDVDVVFPLRRFLELEQEGVVGKVAETHYSFSYVNDVVPLVTHYVPQIVRRMKAQAVDAVMLVPV
jgi:D-proline reductase (dithiol) PrdB